MSQYDKGSLEHQAFFFSDVAVALRLSRLPDYIIDLAYSYRGTALHHAAYHGMLPGLTASHSARTHSPLLCALFSLWRVHFVWCRHARRRRLSPQVRREPLLLQSLARHAAHPFGRAARPHGHRAQAPRRRSPPTGARPLPQTDAGAVGTSPRARGARQGPGPGAARRGHLRPSMTEPDSCVSSVCVSCERAAAEVSMSR